MDSHLDNASGPGDFDLDALVAGEDLDGYEGGIGGLTRRAFLKFCSGIAATMGLSTAMGIKMAQAASAAAKRPSVI